MRVEIVYNEPEESQYTAAGEQAAVDGVLVAVDAVSDALHKHGHTVSKIGLATTDDPDTLIDNIDTDVEVVFNLFEGFGGIPETEFQIAAILEKNGIKHTGCPALALELALNKNGLKNVLSRGGITVAESQLLSVSSIGNFNMTFPCIVKPNSDDASHGITNESVVHDIPSLANRIEYMANTYGYSEVLVEKYIDGREFNVTVMGNEKPLAIGSSEITFHLPSAVPKILTYAGKWEKESQEYKGTIPVCPPDIGKDIQDVLYRIAECAYKLVQCRGYARVDMRMDSSGDVYVLEVNPNPDISPDSGAALHARYAGMDYMTFIETILLLGTENRG